MRDRDDVVRDIDELPMIKDMHPTWVVVEIPPGKRAVARVTGEDPRRSITVRFIGLDELPAEGETVLGFMSEPRGEVKEASDERR